MRAGVCSAFSRRRARYSGLGRHCRYDVADRFRNLDLALGRDLLHDQRHRKERREVVRSDRLERARMQHRRRRRRQVGHQVVPALRHPRFVEQVLDAVVHGGSSCGAAAASQARCILRTIAPLEGARLAPPIAHSGTRGHRAAALRSRPRAKLCRFRSSVRQAPARAILRHSGPRCFDVRTRPFQGRRSCSGKPLAPQIKACLVCSWTPETPGSSPPCVQMQSGL